jgi:hypothetical protein
VGFIVPRTSDVSFKLKKVLQVCKLQYLIFNDKASKQREPQAALACREK